MSEWQDRSHVYNRQTAKYREEKDGELGQRARERDNDKGRMKKSSTSDQLFQFAAELREKSSHTDGKQKCQRMFQKQLIIGQLPSVVPHWVSYFNIV